MRCMPGLFFKNCSGDGVESTLLPTYRTEKIFTLLRMSRNETFDPLSRTGCSVGDSKVSPKGFSIQDRMIAARVARTLARNAPKSLLKVGTKSIIFSYLAEGRESFQSKLRNFGARAE